MKKRLPTIMQAAIRDSMYYYFAAVAIVFGLSRVLKRIRPVPLYTLTRPSPETAEPTRALPDLSVVKFRLPDQQTAKFPSIFNTSLTRLISTSCSLGTLLSNTQIPFPSSFRLNNPIFPSTAEETLLRASTLCLTVPSQARKSPSSRTSPPSQSETS